MSFDWKPIQNMRTLVFQSEYVWVSVEFVGGYTR